MEIELGEIQAEFADIIWKNEPVTSRELVAICEKELNWKKSTTYTVLRKLCEKGLFRNDDGTISSMHQRVNVLWKIPSEDLFPLSLLPSLRVKNSLDPNLTRYRR